VSGAWVCEALCHKLVYVVVVAVLDAGMDASGPRGPQAVADPALAEGRNARERSVRGIAGVEGVGEIEVLNLDRVTACGYPRENIYETNDVRLSPGNRARIFREGARAGRSATRL